jgi:hypothetical protein
MPEPLVAFFPAFANLAESTRLVRIAGRYRALGGRLLFFSHGGEYEQLAETAGLPVHRVEPIYTPEQFDELMRYDRMEKFGDPFPVPWLIEHVRNESRAYTQHGVSLVVTGFNLPCSLSARKAGVPLVWILAGTSFPAYFEAGLATLPDNFDNAVTRLLPERLTRWLTSRIALHVKTGTRAFNTVARRFDLPRFPNVLSLWTGDYTLVSDLPEALNMPARYDYPATDYIGPLLAGLGLPLTTEIKLVPAEKINRLVDLAVRMRHKSAPRRVDCARTVHRYAAAVHRIANRTATPRGFRCRTSDTSSAPASPRLRWQVVRKGVNDTGHMTASHTKMQCRSSKMISRG